MRLDRSFGTVRFLPILALLAVGCGSRVASPPPQVAVAPLSVGTTTTLGAELFETEDVPRVGKSQRSTDPAPVDAEDPPKEDALHRRGDGRPGGGFSGYK
jgi:hypothetical protein